MHQFHGGNINFPTYAINRADQIPYIQKWQSNMLTDSTIYRYCSVECESCNPQSKVTLHNTSSVNSTGRQNGITPVRFEGKTQMGEDTIPVPHYKTVLITFLTPGTGPQACLWSRLADFGFFLADLADTGDLEHPASGLF